jgi:D-sedoheptulose 7-phosphate isomerase
LPGLRVEALPANSGIITCLANDTGYDNIFAHQLQVKGQPGDLLIVLSGSGNSPNIVKALETADFQKMKTFAILAFSGGRCLELAQVPIHFAIDDMQIAEDTQLVVGHLCMQWLNSNKPSELSPLL